MGAISRPRVGRIICPNQMWHTYSRKRVVVQYRVVSAVPIFRDFFVISGAKIFLSSPLQKSGLHPLI